MKSLSYILLLFASAFIIGCHEIRQQSYLDTHPELSYDTARCIDSGEVKPGMSQSEVVASWGKPEIIDHDSGGEAWKYEFWENNCVWVRTLRFEDGKVSSVKSQLIPFERDTNQIHQRFCEKH